MNGNLLLTVEFRDISGLKGNRNLDIFTEQKPEISGSLLLNSGTFRIEYHPGKFREKSFWKVPGKIVPDSSGTRF